MMIDDQVDVLWLNASVFGVLNVYFMARIVV